MFLIILLHVLMASTFMFGKIALIATAPVFLIAVRMIVGGALLLGYQVYKHQELAVWEKKDRLLFAQIIIFHIYCAYIFEFVALQSLSASKSCLIFNGAPFFTAILAYFYFSETLSFKKLLGLVIGFLGFVPLMVQEGGRHLLSVSSAELLMLGAVISSAQGWIVMKQCLQRGYAPFTVNGIGMFCGGFLALITSGMYEGWFFTGQIPVSNWPIFIGSTTALIMIANIIGYNLYGWLLHHYSATFISFSAFITPLFAMVFDWFFLGEPFHATYLISMVVVAVGLYLFYQEELKKNFQLLP